MRKNERSIQLVVLLALLMLIWPNSSMASGLSLMRIRSQFIANFKQASSSPLGGMLCGVGLANAGLASPSLQSIEQYAIIMPALEAAVLLNFKAPGVSKLFDQLPLPIQTVVNYDGRGTERVAILLHNWEQVYRGPKAPDLPIDDFRQWIVRTYLKSEAVKLKIEIYWKNIIEELKTADPEQDLSTCFGSCSLTSANWRKILVTKYGHPVNVARSQNNKYVIDQSGGLANEIIIDGAYKHLLFTTHEERFDVYLPGFRPEVLVRSGKNVPDVFVGTHADLVGFFLDNRELFNWENLRRNYEKQYGPMKPMGENKIYEELILNYYGLGKKGSREIGP